MSKQGLLAVLAYMMERRAKYTSVQPGTIEERLERAQKRLDATEPALHAQLDNPCREYVEEKRAGASPEKLLKLQIQIVGVDSRILADRRGAALLAAIAVLYYRTRLDSVGISQELGVSPISANLSGVAWSGLPTSQKGVS
jgi:hypothetical protein